METLPAEAEHGPVAVPKEPLRNGPLGVLEAAMEPQRVLRQCHARGSERNPFRTASDITRGVLAPFFSLSPTAFNRSFVPWTTLPSIPRG